MTETAELTKAAPAKSGAITMGDKGVQLQTLDDAWRFAQYVVKSGLAPKGVTSAEQALIAMQAGAELGFTPMRALAVITVINGRAGIMGDGALAKIMETGVCSRPPVVTIEGEGDERRGVVRFQRKNMPDPVEVTFSVAQAKTAKLWGKSGPWSEYPDRMLGWRAVGLAGKLYFGDVLMGLVVAEELEDYPPRSIRAEITAPPAEPDPLLAGVRESAPEIIEAETVADQPSDDGASAWMAERANEVIAKISAANTLAGVHRVWKDSEELRRELADKSPDDEKRIAAAHQEKRRELGVKE